MDPVLGLGVAQLGITGAPLPLGLSELLWGVCRGALSHNRPQAATSAASQPWLCCLLASASCHAWQHPAKVQGWAKPGGSWTWCPPALVLGQGQAWPEQGRSARSWA